MESKYMTQKVEIQIRRLNPDADKDVPLPAYMTAGAAGMDIYAAITADVVLGPGEIRLISTGFAMALPQGYEAQVRPRSGLAIKHGVTIVNAPGTIDADYRGEVQIGLINLGPMPYTVCRGERIAQMVIMPVCRGEFTLVDKLDDTGRDSGGFGHTGRA